MKNSLLFLLIFLTSVTGIAQHSSEISGSWKIVSIYDGGVYVNLKNDSVYVSPAMKAVYPDTTEFKKLISNAKITYGNIQFHFEKNAIFRQTMDTVILFTGTYKDIPAQHIFELTTKNSLNQNITDTVQYSIKNECLVFSLKWEEIKFDFILERIK